MDPLTLTRFAAAPAKSPLLSPPIFAPKKRTTFSPIPRPSMSPLVFSPRNDGNEADTRSDSDESKVGGYRRLPFSPFSEDMAMGLVLNATVGRGWTTGSGMEGPSVPAGTGAESATENISTFPWSLFTKSPRRRMLIAFTCNICGQRTTRAINPHAYTDGTVFVQCCGCTAFHKLVDNLNLFQNMNCYLNPNFSYKDSGWDVKFKYLDNEDGEDDTFYL